MEKQLVELNYRIVCSQFQNITFFYVPGIADTVTISVEIKTNADGNLRHLVNFPAAVFCPQASQMSSSADLKQNKEVCHSMCKNFI
ncbi:hypothetical protein PKNOH_S04341800 [Plasmodium knowlesi]|uniref:Uncharacterized protein n=1 Tax=Plasmodium knowlesi TaxID=5850 RepID=A0A1Y3DUY8_PLAKN|nr:hypothetical protein PKNOH_S04341800 [Plasmodium knowlesi]